jgi:hypothetical protein
MVSQRSQLKANTPRPPWLSTMNRPLTSIPAGIDRRANRGLRRKPDLRRPVGIRRIDADHDSDDSPITVFNVTIVTSKTVIERMDIDVVEDRSSLT